MYTNIAKDIEKFTLQLPKTITPTPSESDYMLGFVYRYFIKKANDDNAFIFEISETDYEDYHANPLWTGYRIKWRISGPTNTIYKDNGNIDDRGVSASNKAAIGLASRYLKNISLYLPNLLQLYK